METARLIIRNWQDADFLAFYRLNNDPNVMEFFPKRLDEQEAFEKFHQIRENNEKTSFVIYALEDKASGRLIGLCGLQEVHLIPIIPAGKIEIAWRILPEFQRRGFAFEAAQHIMNDGFQRLAVNEIIAFTAAVNLPSLGLMQKLGMRELLEKRFIHPKVPDNHAHLKPHRIFAVHK
ncbi:GNAT family N-acetyltransferase [Bartonella sp. HY761]|uniref:GNAT family N-acetyltransferase n=1 Tax=Bartonella sp. HY761 TaxID=2979330 RepID=UPI0021F98CB4|nr:GNAT family N-acetyltransferase [Bartonella sp. HY761]UXN05499.1 GNAT family N-acetyltransferase [Bartonella sp. HY761]